LIEKHKDKAKVLFRNLIDELHEHAMLNNKLKDEHQ